MIIELFFIIGSIPMFYYAIKYKDDKERYIKFPIIIGFLSLLFAVFRWFDNVTAEILVGLPLLFFIFGNNFLKKITKNKLK